MDCVKGWSLFERPIEGCMEETDILVCCFAKSKCSSCQAKINSRDPMKLLS